MSENVTAWKDFAKQVLAADPARKARVVWTAPDGPLRFQCIRGPAQAQLLQYVSDLWRNCGSEGGYLSPLDWAVEEMLEFLEQEAGEGAVLGVFSCFAEVKIRNLRRSIQFTELVSLVAMFLDSATKGEM